MPNGTVTRSAEETARKVGTSARKVNRARTVLSDPKEKEAVRREGKSVTGAQGEGAIGRPWGAR